MLTELEKNVLDTIHALHAALERYPTCADVKEHINISPAEVAIIIRQLIRCGFVDRIGDILRPKFRSCFFMGWDRDDGETFFVRRL